MVQFIRCCTYKNIQKKFILLYSLNISDILFTLVLLKTGLFREVNGIVAEFVGNTALSLFLKIVLVGILIFIIFKRMESATEKQLRKSNIIIDIALLSYIIINLMHLSYVLLYVIII